MMIIDGHPSRALTLEKGKKMSKTLIYTTNGADERYETVLSINPNGAAYLKIGSNRDRKAWPAGLFSGDIPLSVLQALTSVVDSDAFLNSESQVRLVPDESYRQIRLVANDKSEVSKLFGSEVKPTIAFLKAEELIEKIMQHLYRTPVFAASASSDISPFSGTKIDRKFVFSISVRNVGSKAFFIDSPTHWSREAKQAEVVAVRSDVPLAELSSRHQYFLSLDKGSLIENKLLEQGPLTKLAPGQTLAFRFKQDLAWTPGQYKVDVGLNLTLKNDERQSMITAGLACTTHNLAI
jgi:hypothetical protein